MPKRRRGGSARARAVIETSAGGVIYRWNDGRAHVLLIRDAYHHWGFPKGHVEESESASEAALREVAEETGLTELRLGPRLRTIDWFFRFRGKLIHKFCHFYLIECPAGDTCPQQEEGITECIWLPLDEAIQSISYDNAREVLVLAAERLLVNDTDAVDEEVDADADDHRRRLVGAPDHALDPRRP